jgi:autotransporter-associated beta strand protein
MVWLGLCLLASISLVQGATKTWTGADGGDPTNYNDANNWSVAGVPGSNDTALFSTGGAPQPNVTTSASVKILNFTAGGYDLTSSSTAITLTLLSTTSGAGNSAIAVQTSGTTTIDAPLVLGAVSAQTFSVGSGGTLQINGVVSGTAPGLLLSTGNAGSIIVMNGATNTYIGETTIAGPGTVKVSSIGTSGNPGNLGTNAVIGIGSGTTAGTLNYTGTGETTDRTVDLSGTTGGATIDTTGASGGLVFSGNFTASGAGGIKTLTLQGNTNNNAINGVVMDSAGGATSLIKNGSGTWTLGGANTYTGTTTLRNGALSVSSLGTIGNPGNLGEGSIIGLGQGNNAVILQYTGAGETTDHIFDLQGTTGSVTIDTSTSTGPLVIIGNVTASGAGSKTLTLNGGQNDNIQGVISDNSAVNTTSVLKQGNGTWILSGANTYSGGTTIKTGTLSVSSLGNAGNPGNLGTNATINIGQGGNNGTLAYTGAGETTDRVINLNGTNGNATIDTTNDTGPLIFTSDFTATGAGNKTLTLKGGNNDIVQGAIVDNSPTNKTSLNKTGNGTWIIAGANTYTGGTTVTGGTLRVNGANANLGTGNVSVLSSANSLNISGNVLNAIADTATLNLAGGGTAGVADAGFARLGTGIDEVVGALILGGNPELPGTYGATGSGATTIMDEYFAGSGFVTVVPEPSVYGLVIMGSGLLLGAQRFRRRS